MIEKEFYSAIKAEIDELAFPNYPAELYDPLRYILDLGGKRLRPILTLYGHYLFNDEWKKALKPALAVEVFHNFSLIHDDLMDAAPLRRGKPTVHEKWNSSTAILSGDVMLVEAYKLLLNMPAELLPRGIELFSKTAAEVCEGQQLDMNYASLASVSKDEYLDMIRLKTAVLLGFALALGALIAGASVNDQNAIYDAGVNIGLGFQLDDDILDVYGDPATFGKQIGGDIIENKKTLMLITALNMADKENLQKLNLWMTSTNAEEKVKAVRGIFDDLGIRKIAEEIKLSYFQKGIDQIKKINVPLERQNQLIDFSWALLNRNS